MSFTDTLAAGGLCLLKMLLCKSSRVKIHILLYEYHGEDLLDGLPLDVQSRITIHDFVSDPLGWLGSTERIIQCDVLTYLQTACIGSANDETLVVIDSLSNLILHRSLAYTCQIIQSVALRRKTNGDAGTQMVVGVHRDLHDSSVLSQLEHIANTVLTLSPPVSPGYTVTCSILNKKVTGKIVKSKEEYKLGEKFELVECQDVTSVIKSTSVESTVDPTANLTFKLSLCDSEKEARSQTQLPYVYDKLRQSEALNKSVGEGKIFYQPDEADDFDEEDPDDDLDI